MKSRIALPTFWHFAALMVVVSNIALAQVSRGDKFLGGTLGLSTQDVPDSPNGGLTPEVRSFSIYPSMGFLVSDNLAIGGQLGYYTYSNKSSGNYDFHSHYFSIGIFTKRYFPISDSFLFTLTGTFQFRRGSEVYNDTAGQPLTESQLYDLSIGIRPGFLFFPSSHWGIEASIGTISYVYRSNLSTENTSNNFDLNYGIFSIGFAYYFRK